MKPDEEDKGSKKKDLSDKAPKANSDKGKKKSGRGGRKSVK